MLKHCGGSPKWLEAQSLQGTLLYMAVLCHCILCKDTDQFSAACLSADDGLHDELPKGSALNAVNTEGYRNDEFKAIHIIADAVVLPDMTAYTLLFQNAVLEYSLDSLAHIAAEYIIHVGNLLHGHPYSIGRHGYRSALADSYNSSVHFPIVFRSIICSFLAWQ